MSGFQRDVAGRACLGGVAIEDLLEQASCGTPAYLYDLDAIAQTARGVVSAFGDAPHLVAYAVKANSAGTILRTLAREACGADVVSGGELELALACGIPPVRIVMSGVAKTDDEIDLALSHGIRALQVESVEELTRIAGRARATTRTARVSLRVNPGVAIDSHRHIATGHDEAKFGIATEDLPAAWQLADSLADLVRVIGVSTHVGSMLSTTAPYRDAARAVCEVARARRTRGGQLEYVDFGGGFGIDYGGNVCEPPEAFVRAGLALLEEEGLGDLALVVEPGRALVGPYGVLVASVVQTKRSGARRWVLLDAAMNDLIRPALYSARHRIEPLDAPPQGEGLWHLAGPVCESADVFGEHPLGDAPPTRVVLRDAGAYGFVMASEYNGRPLAAEVFVAGGRVVHVRPSPGREAWVRGRLDA
jgi:diaminopimelate decarboxylase